MKKTMIAVFAVLGLIVFSVPMAIATPTIYIDQGLYQYGSGGEFRVTPDSSLSWVLNNYSADTKNQGADSSFQTFCVEYGEHFSFGKTYDAGLSDSAVYGGVGPAGDPLSIGAAWLYHEFQTSGNFDGIVSYDYSNPGRSDGESSSAAQLQLAIWMLEGEYSLAPNPFVGAAITKFGSLSNAQADNYSAGVRAYDVMILNLYEEGHFGEADYRVQDQLVCVPDASIMLLLGPALIGMGILGRRRKVNNL